MVIWEDEVVLKASKEAPPSPALPRSPPLKQHLASPSSSSQTECEESGLWLRTETTRTDDVCWNKDGEEAT